LSLTGDERRYARSVAGELQAVVDRATWAPAPVFNLLARLGAVPRRDLERTLNLGVGMVAVVAADHVPAAVERLHTRGVPAWALGEVSNPRPHLAGDVTQGAKGMDGGAVRLVGRHPAVNTLLAG
jgi:phosphoribosylformylglycinamidine cyclo-ligase